MNTEKTTAFDWDNLWARSERLYYYIKQNLYSDSIAVQTKGKIIVFAWSFEPQNTGTFTQRESYQRMKIQDLVKMIENNLKNYA